MKNLFAILLVTLLSVGTTFGQDAFKALKEAEKAIKKFNSDPKNKADELANGMKLLETAFASEDVKAVAKSWITKGKLLKAVAKTEFNNFQLDTSYVIAAPGTATKAYDAYAMAAKLAEKKNEKKEVQIGLSEMETHLNNYAIVAYQEQNFGSAFENFSRSISVADDLTAMGKESRLDDPKVRSEQNFFAAVSSYYDKNFDGSKPYLETLYNAGTEEAFVYEALYNISSETDPDGALAYLAKGREVKPDDPGLLFAEINHYLKKGELNKLISKLELALEKEPDNVSIFNTIGGVYDQLHQKETDATKSTEYFDKALDYYTQGLEKEPTNFDATYSVGALYYNKAASYVDELNALASDLTPAGMKKYDALKIEMDALFKQALPHFEKAESLNSNDGNTIIALKEIYARLNNLEKSAEYKTKMDALGK